MTDTLLQVVENKPVDSAEPHVLVVGSGPVGVRFVHELLKRKPNSRITLLGEEGVHPYNRVQLSSLLAGKVSVDDIRLELPVESDRFTFIQCRITSINTVLKRVVDDNEDYYLYDQLVLATGARPHVPNITGVDQSGVYTFRNLRDAEFLYARTSRAKHVVIIGGGLLGIETAKALLKNNTKITIIQQGPYLMNKQLDSNAAEILAQQLFEIGVRVITDAGVRHIKGEGRVSGVILRSRELIECDTVVFCSGISPNMEMARTARLRVNRGVVVDSNMQTSDQSIYAIGECCEFDGFTYGIVNPGYEQAAVLAEVLTGNDVHYRGSLLSSSLKVIDTPVRSFGKVVNYTKTPFDHVLVYQEKESYRKLVIQRGEVIGGVSVGEWNDYLPTLEAFQQKRKFNILQRWLFKLKGSLFFRGQSNDVSTWSPEAVVCQCNNVTQGELVAALKTDCKTVCDLGERNRAGTVCGSCVPLLEQLVEKETGLQVERQKEWAWSPMLVMSIGAFVAAALVLFMPGLSVGSSVTDPAPFESLWNDKWWKQVTGFALLGLSVVGLLMSLRKRIKSDRFGDFSYWRMLHIVLGVFSVALLFFHSGWHLGENLNRALMLNFLFVIALGSFAGLVVSLSHRLPAHSAQNIRKFWSWAHILVTWPLPVLLAIHIFTVYYY